MNVCTFGYTSPFWGWDEWEREIDWMALHGFDMPLAPIAGEAILARVWRRMGLTDEEIGVLFTGPAHLPWMRMGNMSGLDGAPTPQWHEAQIALQHRIIDRMEALGMTPVYQGFAGFVPPAMKRIHPETTLTETKWSGFKNWMLSPLDPLFSEIGTAFIRAWEEEFGKGKYYLIDSFNEMDVPFGPKGSPERAATLRHYGETIYRSLAEANPDCRVGDAGMDVRLPAQQLGPGERPGPVGRRTRRTNDDPRPRGGFQQLHLAQRKELESSARVFRTGMDLLDGA